MITQNYHGGRRKAGGATSKKIESKNARCYEVNGCENYLFNLQYPIGEPNTYGTKEMRDDDDN